MVVNTNLLKLGMVVYLLFIHTVIIVFKIVIKLLIHPENINKNNKLKFKYTQVIYVMVSYRTANFWGVFLCSTLYIRLQIFTTISIANITLLTDIKTVLSL